MNKIELNIKGIKCEGCVKKKKNVLSSIKGIDSFDILVEDKKLLLSVKNEKIVNEIIRKMEALGFSISK